MPCRNLTVDKMQIDTKVHAGIAALIYPMANAVIFGSGLITVLTLPPLNANAMTWIPVIAVTSFVLAAPVAWLIAPRLRRRYWVQREAEQRG